MQEIIFELRSAKNQLEKDLDSLATKLIETSRDTTLKGKTDTEATADEMKRLFTVDKAVLDQAKTKAEEDLAATNAVYAQNLDVGRQWQDSCSRWSDFIADISLKLGGMIMTKQWAAMEVLAMEHTFQLKAIKDCSASKHGLTIEKPIQATTVKEKNIQATASGS